MLHKMLIFKRGIDFSSVRRQTLFPTLFPWEEGIPSSKRNQFQLELIPKFGISSWNRFRNSILFKNLGSALHFPVSIPKVVELHLCGAVIISVVVAAVAAAAVAAAVVAAGAAAAAAAAAANRKFQRSISRESKVGTLCSKFPAVDS